MIRWCLNRLSFRKAMADVFFLGKQRRRSLLMRTKLPAEAEELELTSEQGRERKRKGLQVLLNRLWSVGLLTWGLFPLGIHLSRRTDVPVWSHIAHIGRLFFFCGAATYL
jgi:hypothetical protein